MCLDVLACRHAFGLLDVDFEKRCVGVQMWYETYQTNKCNWQVD